VNHVVTEAHGGGPTCHVVFVGCTQSTVPGRQLDGDRGVRPLLRSAEQVVEMI
jgi:hypothetical protein